MQQVKLGRPLGLRSLTDTLGLTRRKPNILKIPMEFLSVAGQLKLDLAIYMEFVGEPFPIGSSISFCIADAPTFANEAEMNEDSFFHQGFLPGPHAFDIDVIHVPFYKLPIKTLERRNSALYQETETLVFDSSSDDKESLYSFLHETSWRLIRDEEKFCEFRFTNPTDNKLESSLNLPAGFRRRWVS